jgi:hypothetical protein
MKYRNILVQYKGGGYDGCYWEWNFFLFDAKGSFHNLMSTGRHGIKTKDDAKTMLKSKEYGYKYNIKSKKDRTEFENETHQGLVGSIVTLVNKAYNRDVMSWHCDDCNAESYDNEYMYHTDEYRWTDKVCGDCYSQYICGYCGANNNPEENNVTEEGRCIYCAPKEEIKIIENNTKVISNHAD